MQTHCLVQSLAPSKGADNTQKQTRGDGFGAVHIRQELYAWLEEGAYFKATNQTPGTGIPMGIQTSFSDTANVLMLIRSASATKVIVPHYLRLINTTAGASTTSSHLLIATDTANRYSSGGSDITTEIVNAHSGQAPASVLDVFRFGAVTASAVSARRKVTRAVLKTQAAPCWSLGDEVLILWTDDPGMGLLSGAGAARFVVNAGPLLLAGANHCMLVHIWNPANATTAPNWEFEFAWWER